MPPDPSVTALRPAMVIHVAPGFNFEGEMGGSIVVRFIFDDCKKKPACIKCFCNIPKLAFLLYLTIIVTIRFLSPTFCQKDAFFV